MRDQPATIQDAIHMARKLGFRLRIHSLCIIQNHITDKNSEITRMVQIYQHSTLFVSGARANTASKGFFRMADSETLERYESDYPTPLQYRKDGAQGYVMLEKFISRLY